MENYKYKVLDKITYTELVYGRINKKLNLNYSKEKIQELISKIVFETHESHFVKKGKNIYITNHEKNIVLTININTNRIITATTINI
ncbi:DUF3781 domain-containing protein [Frigoriflavimonas asaccharolytica]|uniref:DUF3781 domain-containing protein n=1 Tax=Frigoriflavimonas asaccharolytica TaxID=2735899 RepID=A0A8J8G8R8_9FLAO|nr:hypothetical protein [Frigoriflavimonas asaccharolytica]